MMNKVAIIQARMSSTRLPGKVLKTINEKPLIEYQIERIKRCHYIDNIVIATTINNIDDEIVDFCKRNNIDFYRGSEEDVLSRYYEAAKKFKADTIIRLTSDCPIIDPDVVDKIVETYLENNHDYVSNTLERTYPRGLDAEVFSFSALEEMQKCASALFEREHVTPYIYLSKDKFSILNVCNNINNSHHRWTVDTMEDFQLVEKLINNLYPTKANFTMKDVLSLLDNKPDWVEINAHVEQKKLEDK